MNIELSTQYQQFIHKSRYARWLPDKGRRETWEETVDRYVNFVCDNRNVDPETKDRIRTAILNCEVMPSMRAMMTAGPAAERCNVAMYNCSYAPVSDLDVLSEILYILMCGTGVGLSVERKYVEQLPVVPATLEYGKCFTVEDSKEGWAESLRFLLIMIFHHGVIPHFDYSLLRPKGARLMTMGGRSSGPEPLKKLLDFVTEICKKAAGRKLKPIEVHDICCMIGEVVVVGGVRRSAMISLFDRGDKEMLAAKAGEWWKNHPWRALANNSAVYESKPSVSEFLSDWRAIHDSYSGEPGIFNREACKKIADNFGRDIAEFGTNPCSEIILRPYQFCNLTEVVVRAEDTDSDLARKVEIATILGTLQASFTDFKFLSNRWKQTTDYEALLGVSMTGVTDRGLDWDGEILDDLRDLARFVNADWADRLEINEAAAITCVKPSGTVSQLVDSSSGLHPRHSDYYIRRVRGDAKDPMTLFLMSQGVEWEWAQGKAGETVVFSFPVMAPPGAATRNDLTAVDHLDLWLQFQQDWCEHKPSVTINIREHEWIAVAARVWEQWDWMSGVAFLPYDGGTYAQAPYEEIDYKKYEELAAQTPTLDWTKLAEFEHDDQTNGSQTFACTGGACEIVDIGGG